MIKEQVDWNIVTEFLNNRIDEIVDKFWAHKLSFYPNCRGVLDLDKNNYDVYCTELSKHIIKPIYNAIGLLELKNLKEIFENKYRALLYLTK